MTTALSPYPQFRAFDSGGVPLAGGLVYTYLAGTNTPQPTYQDASGLVPNTNPVTLDTTGKATIRLTSGVSYKFVVADASNATQDTIDNYAASYLTANDINLLINGVSSGEIANAVTPTNYSYRVADPRRYGAVGDGINDDTVAVQTAVNLLQLTGGRLVVDVGCYYKCTADILFTPVTGKTVDVTGPGWDCGGFLFSGAAVTHGLYFNAATYGTYGPTVRDLRLISTAGAIGGLVFVNLNQPLVTRCFVNAAAGRGIFFNACILPSMVETLLNGCGSPTTGSVEVDGGDNGVTPSTDFNWAHCYIQGGGNASLGGLLIDHTNAAVIVGGAINSTAGSCIKIASKVAATASVANITIQNIDLENPGNGNFFIDAGQGITTASLCGPATVQNIGAYASGTTMMGSGAVRLANTVSWDFADNLFSLPSVYTITAITKAASAVVTSSSAAVANPFAVGFGMAFYGVVGMTQINGLFGTVSANGGSAGAWTATVNINSSGYGVYSSGGTAGPICTFNVSGTANLGTRVQPHRSLYGFAYPWVMINSVFIHAAGPHLDWVQGSSPLGFASLSSSLVGATPSILILAAQGGFYRSIAVANGGGTTVTALTGGESGMEITLVASDANTTLTHSTSVADQFNLIGNGNLTMASGKAYKFIHNGTLWVQV